MERCYACHNLKRKWHWNANNCFARFLFCAWGFCFFAYWSIWGLNSPLYCCAQYCGSPLCTVAKPVGCLARGSRGRWRYWPTEGICGPIAPLEVNVTAPLTERALLFFPLGRKSTSWQYIQLIFQNKILCNTRPMCQVVGCNMLSFIFLLFSF